ncbi:Hypothetical predicted protein [Paramuricea clavata]|uniref:Uncharacterized protein n=1 Tax=Paramuricea clavata TaxID=317549 RepID=A0A6S7GBX0_PARCT|nr:Hypothetical predicted protein [Paramuricea clavata]
MVFSSGAKKEVEQLPEAVQARIKSTVRYAKIWTGLVIVATGVLIASKPYLDKLRSQDEQNNVQIAKPRVKMDNE